jgi:DNA-binding MarR family transcriptional regulator
MGKALAERIRHEGKLSTHQEALLNLLVAADRVRAELDRACQEFGLTHGQYNVLRIVRGGPEGRTRMDIAARMVERAPDVTRIVDRLEQRGLVERAQGTADRRQSITRITKGGRDLLDEMEPAIGRAHAWFASRLSRASAGELSRLCETIHDE